MPDLYDVAVVGAGPAGLSAALTLGRGRRRVLLLDDDHPRNAPAANAWGFITRDGVPPDDLRALGRAELGRYDVDVVDGHVDSAERTADGFRLCLGDGGSVEARGLVLATGIADVLPDVPGMREAWGAGVVHCPYCHGWDFCDRPTAVYGSGHDAFETGRFLTLWTGTLTVVSDGPADLTPEQRAELGARGVAVDERRVGRIEQEDGHVRAVVFEDGGRLDVEAVYVKPDVRPRSGLAESLGAHPMPSRILVTDECGRVENVPLLYLAGDTTEKQHQVSLAVASGVRAAFALNHDLLVADTPDVAV